MSKDCPNRITPDPLRVIADANVRDDVYRSAEQAIVAEGESITQSLEELAQSSDVIVRGRATELLRRIRGLSSNRAG